MTEQWLCQEKFAPAAPPLIRLVALNARYVHSCLALFYIRNELTEHFQGCEVELLQLTINDNSYESLLQITAGRPFAVFFSAAIWNSEQVAHLAAEVRSCLPQCRIVVGGPQAGVLRRVLGQEVCTAVIGEIEEVGEEFYRDLATGQLRPQYGGSLRRTGNRRLVYPFREEDFSGQLKNRHIYYETSRGCPYACTYCLSAAERGVYHKGLDQVREELGSILQHNPGVVRFVDRTFNDSPQRALAIWEFLLQQECDTLFHFEMAPDRFTEEMFALLKTVKHGRFQFEIGIQSTSEATLDAIRRRMDAARVHEIVSRLAGLATIHLHVDLILGLPYETAESFASSFAQVFAMGAHYIQMGLLKILPDTPICHQAEEYGYLHSARPPYAVFANRWLDHEQLAELYWFCECVEKFHNNRFFVSFWRHLRANLEDIFIFFLGLLQAARHHGYPQRAATQEHLTEILVSYCGDRPDSALIVELLRYDWLRCGFRALPSCLRHRAGEETPEATRDLLYSRMGSEAAGLYSARTRNQFFKRSTFIRLSGAAAKVLGLVEAAVDVRLVVLPEREATLFGHNRIFLTEHIDPGQ